LKYNNMQTAIKPAQGLEVTLMHNAATGQLMAREYRNDGSFVDYDIWHSDMTVVIVDPDAWIYQTQQTSAIDHSPQTLGIDPATARNEKS